MESQNEENLVDVLSHSYCQGIGRISGAQNKFVTDFKVPEEVIKERQESWSNLFNKYTEQVVSAVELNLETLEPIEERGEKENEVSSEEWYVKVGIPMRKSPTLIQYWIDTGNPPCKALDKREYSGSGSSLSERESLNSPSVVKLRDIRSQLYDKRIACARSSSYSSIDTAVYILSNTNVTRKAETLAIVEGAKHSEPDTIEKRIQKSHNQISPKDKLRSNFHTSVSSMAIEEDLIETDGQIHTRLETIKDPHSQIHINSDIICETEECMEKRNTPIPKAIDINFSSQESNSDLEIPDVDDEINDLTHSNVDDQNYAETNVNNESSDENIFASQVTSLSSSTFSRFFNRKKLYTGRDSPVDLTVQMNSGSQVSRINESLHPALDPTCNSSEKKRRKKRKIRKHISFDKMIESKSEDKSVDSIKSKKKEETSEDKTENSDYESNQATSTHLPLTESLQEFTANASDVQNNDDLLNSIVNSEEPDIASVLNPMSAINIKACGNKGTEKINDKVEHTTENSDTTIQLNRTTVDHIENDNLQNILVTSGDMIELKKAETRLEKDFEKAGKNTSKVQKNLNNACEIETLDTETVDSDQSTILIYQCKDDESTKSFTRSVVSNMENICSAETRISQNNIVDNHKSPVKENVKSDKNIVQMPVILLNQVDISLYTANASRNRCKTRLTSKQNLEEKSESTKKKLNTSEIIQKEENNIDVNKKLPIVLLERLELEKFEQENDDDDNDSINIVKRKREGAKRKHNTRRKIYLHSSNDDDNDSDDDLVNLTEHSTKKVKLTNTTNRETEQNRRTNGVKYRTRSINFSLEFFSNSEDENSEIFDVNFGKKETCTPSLKEIRKDFRNEKKQKLENKIARDGTKKQSDNSIQKTDLDDSRNSSLKISSSEDAVTTRSKRKNLSLKSEDSSHSDSCSNKINTRTDRSKHKMTNRKTHRSRFQISFNSDSEFDVSVTSTDGTSSLLSASKNIHKLNRHNRRTYKEYSKNIHSNRVSSGKVSSKRKSFTEESTRSMNSSNSSSTENFIVTDLVASENLPSRNSSSTNRFSQLVINFDSSDTATTSCTNERKTRTSTSHSEKTKDLQKSVRKNRNSKNNSRDNNNIKDTTVSYPRVNKTVRFSYFKETNNRRKSLRKIKDRMSDTSEDDTDDTSSNSLQIKRTTRSSSLRNVENLRKSPRLNRDSRDNDANEDDDSKRRRSQRMIDKTKNLDESVTKVPNKPLIFRTKKFYDSDSS